MLGVTETIVDETAGRERREYTEQSLEGNDNQFQIVKWVSIYA